MKHKTIGYLSLLFLFNPILGNDKIVGLMQVRNEENFIEQHLRALAYYTDSIVIIDDASTDSTPTILQSLAQELNIEKIIFRKISTREDGNESDNSQVLLDTGRKIGGTHFIIIDADEMFTANCLENSFLRNKILSLNPGDVLEVNWIQLWRSTNYYRIDKWIDNYGDFIFCDDGKCCYNKKFLHATRSPNNLHGHHYRIEGRTHGLLHFQFVNWINLLIKQSWYRCLEHIRCPNKLASEINKIYAPSKDESGLTLKDILSYWLECYQFFDHTIYDKIQEWRKNQVLSWFDKHGKEYFKDLDIWDIDWEQ